MCFRILCHYVIARPAAKLDSSCWQAICGRFSYLYLFLFYSFITVLAQGYFCGLFLRLRTLRFSPGVLHARAVSRPGSCVLYFLASRLGGGGGGGEHHNHSCMRRERIEFIQSREDGPFSSLSLFYGCRQCCLLSLNERDRLSTTPASLLSCGRQESNEDKCVGTSVLSLAWRLCPSSLVWDILDWSTLSVVYIRRCSYRGTGYVSLGSQLCLNVHHRVWCYFFVLTAVNCLHFFVLICVSKLG